MNVSMRPRKLHTLYLLTVFGVFIAASLVGVVL